MLKLMQVATLHSGARNLDELIQCEPDSRCRPFKVEMVLEASTPDFDTFCKDMTQDFTFANGLCLDLYADEKGVYHCLLLQEKGAHRGLLVADDYTHVYYSYVPDCRLLQLDGVPRWNATPDGIVNKSALAPQHKKCRGQER